MSLAERESHHPGKVTLHDIREELDKAATGAVTKSMSKDFTNVPDRDLAASLL